MSNDRFGLYGGTRGPYLMIPSRFDRNRNETLNLKVVTEGAWAGGRSNWCWTCRFWSLLLWVWTDRKLKWNGSGLVWFFISCRVRDLQAREPGRGVGWGLSITCFRWTLTCRSHKAAGAAGSVPQTLQFIQSLKNQWIRSTITDDDMNGLLKWMDY